MENRNKSLLWGFVLSSVLILLSGFAVAEVVPLRHFRLNEDSGTVIHDDGTSPYDGTVTNVVQLGFNSSGIPLNYSARVPDTGYRIYMPCEGVCPANFNSSDTFSLVYWILHETTTGSNNGVFTEHTSTPGRFAVRSSINSGGAVSAEFCQTNGPCNIAWTPNLNNHQWYMIVIRYYGNNNTGSITYNNCTTINYATYGQGPLDNASGFRYKEDFTQVNYFDDFRAYDYYINETICQLLFNNGLGTNESQVLGAAAIGSVLAAYPGQDIYNASEAAEWVAQWNYTIDGSSNGTAVDDSLGQCNVTLDYGNSDVFNFNLSAGDSELVNVSGIVNASEYILVLDACHDNNPAGNLSVYNTLDDNTLLVRRNLLPMCSNPYRTRYELNISTLDQVVLNFSLDSLGNNSIQVEGFVQQDRSFVGEMSFSAGLWNYSFGYYDPANVSASVDCYYFGDAVLDASDTAEADIHTPGAYIGFTKFDINDNWYDTVNETTLEYYNGAYNLHFFYACYDLTYLNYTLLNGIGEVEASASSATAAPYLEAEFQSDLLLDIENPYLFTVTAGNSFGNVSEEITFFINDTMFPSAVGILNTTQAQNSSYSFNVTFEDEAFYSYSVICNNSFAENVTGLNTTWYMANFTYNVTDSDILCIWHWCDAHTAAALRKDWKIEKSEEQKELKFKVNDKELKLRYMGSDKVKLRYEKKADRVSFEIEFPDKKKGVLQDHIFYYYISGNSHYFESSLYPAWIVDYDSRTWFDMVGADVSSVFEVSPGVWEITVSSRDTVIHAESIGELNCYDATQLTSVEAEAGFTYTIATMSCPDDLPGIVTYIFAFALLVTFLVLNWSYIRIPILTILTGFGLIWFSYAFMGCHWFIGAVGIVFAIGLIGKGVSEAL